MSVEVVTGRSLADCEADVQNFAVAWLRAGSALAEIRDRKLYPREYGEGGFDAYCRERWAMSKTTANHLIAAADVTAIAVKFELPSPSSESVARELAPLRKKPSVLRKVWERATAAADKPTAAQVKAIRVEVAPPRRKPKPPQPADYLEHLLPSAAPDEALHARIVAACREWRAIDAQLDEGLVPFLPNDPEDRKELLAALDLVRRSTQRITRRMA